MVLAAILANMPLTTKTMKSAQNINTALAIFGLSLCVAACDTQPSSTDPYTSRIETYPDNWEPRTFKCLKYDHIPDFTLGYYSNPNENELALLCSCIDKAFPARFGEKIKLCTKDERTDTGQ